MRALVKTPGRRGRCWSAAVALIAALLAPSLSARTGSAGPGTATLFRAGEGRVDRFAAVHFDPVPGDLAGNREKLAALATRAAREGARYIVLPELALTGPMTVDGARWPEPIPGPTTRRFAALSHEFGVWLALSLAEQAGGGHAVTSVLIDPKGRLASQVRKRVLRPNGEDGKATVGFARVLLDTVDDQGRRLGVLSGDDLLDGVPRLADRGADVLLVTANWSPADPVRWNETAAELARSYRVHLVIANRRSGLGGIAPRDGAVAARSVEGGIELASLGTAGRRWQVATGLGLPSMPLPAHQPFTPELVELGRELFFDTGLSSTGEVSCASCHRPGKLFSDGRARGEGVRGRKTLRNTPSLLNAGYRTPLQWDGNPTTLEQQFKYPLSGFSELNLRSHEDLLAYIRSRPSYMRRFRTELGVAPDQLSREHVALALASYLRTLVSSSSPFDRYYFGGDEQALSTAARRGLELFTGKAGCAECHQIEGESALFMDSRFHRLGIDYIPERDVYADPGVGVVSSHDYAGMFFTPSLRNVAETAPYMHDGSIATLEEAIRAHYWRPELDATLEPLELSAAEVDDLVALLRSLTGEERYDEQGRKIVPTPRGTPNPARSRRLNGPRGG